MSKNQSSSPTSSHWGNYRVTTKNGQLHTVEPYASDPDPTPIGQSLLNSQDPGCRVPQPMVRKGYLDNPGKSDGSARGKEPFVPVDWPTAIRLAADALDGARKEHGNESIYGGSYGWASAGRFHHAQSQIHRFLNLIGGYSYSVDSYSAGAAQVIIPHILGMPFYEVMFQAPTVEDMIKNKSLVVCFGGIAMKNTQIMQGGLGAHTAHDQLQDMHDAGVEFVNISPIKDDMSDHVKADWWPCRPNSDVALMLALAHTLYSNNLHDTDFLETYCEGFDQFEPYLTGETDGVVKDAAWAEAITEIPAKEISAVAKRMAAKRTVIGISWSLQRSEFGEQTYWMATTLAAMLGTHGLKGGGVAYGYGSVHNIGFSGRKLPPFKVGAFPQGKNPVETHIPVARISDMLLNPGSKIDYNGNQITFPDIKVVYWAGGNPFHHHQDLNRLRQAWSKPETIIINEPFWTAAARHADIVFPCTVPLERNDISANPLDCYLSPMKKAVEPFAESKSDFDIFSLLANELGIGKQFSEERNEMEWVEFLYKETRDNAAKANIKLPSFEDFWSGEQITISDQIPETTFTLEKFRDNPETHPLKTPSGKIEIFSSTIDSYNYDNCIGHASWFAGDEWLGSKLSDQFPLHLISNQPKTRLHSQYDHGVTSKKAKVHEREIVRINPSDATTRNLADDEIVRIYNTRGACLAAVKITENVRSGVVELPTGAWYHPQAPHTEGSLEIHGNPNVLTRDVGTSKLAQGTTAHSCLVEIEKFKDSLPEITIFSQPDTINN